MASSSSHGKAPKSILKTTRSPEEQEKDATAARNMELALHHAHLIQHEKDAEAAILDSIEALIEYPFQTNDPANPDIKDIKEVKTHLSLFRPSDFDSAVQERNLDEKCGYMLCPKPRTKQKTTAKYRLLRKGNLRVVENSGLEKWCSDECAKRALYLRVQVKETPPWLRSGSAEAGLQLLGETSIPQISDEMEDVTKDLQQLALERGDHMNSFREKFMQIDLQERFENMAIEDPVPPSLSAQNDGLRIEGYTSGLAKDRMKDPLDIDIINDRGDILDTI